MSETKERPMGQICMCGSCDVSIDLIERMDALPTLVKKADWAVLLTAGLVAFSCVLVLLSLSSLPYSGPILFVGVLLVVYSAWRVTVRKGERSALIVEYIAQRDFALAKVRFLDGSERVEMHCSENNKKIAFSGTVVSARALVFTMSAEDLAARKTLRGEVWTLDEGNQRSLGNRERCLVHVTIQSHHLALSMISEECAVEIIAEGESFTTTEGGKRRPWRLSETAYGFASVFEILPEYLAIKKDGESQSPVADIAEVVELRKSEEVATKIVDNLKHRTKELELIIDEMGRELAFVVLFLRATRDGGVYNTPAGPVLSTHFMFVLKRFAKLLHDMEVEVGFEGAGWLVMALEDRGLFILLNYVRVEVVGENSIDTEREALIKKALGKWKEPAESSMTGASWKNVFGKDTAPFYICPVCMSSIGSDKDAYCHNCNAFSFAYDLGSLQKSQEITGATLCPSCKCPKRTVTSEGDACADCGLAVSKFSLYKPYTSKPKGSNCIGGSDCQCDKCAIPAKTTLCPSCEKGQVGGEGSKCTHCGIMMADLSKAKLPPIVGPIKEGDDEKARTSGLAAMTLHISG